MHDALYPNSEKAKIDRTEIANGTDVLAKLLNKTCYDKNARPQAGGKFSSMTSENRYVTRRL